MLSSFWRLPHEWPKRVGFYFVIKSHFIQARPFVGLLKKIYTCPGGWGGETLRTRSDRPWWPPSPLYNRYRVFPKDKAVGAWLSPPIPSRVEVKEKVDYTSTSPLGLRALFWGELYLYLIYDSFIHLVVCLTTDPKPLPKRALHIVRSRAFSFKWEYHLLSLKSSSSFLRLIPRLPVTSITPFIFPSTTRYGRQFLHKMWPIQSAFLLSISYRISYLINAQKMEH
jgi:hypothetical protein